jgi:hypothetical protein
VNKEAGSWLPASAFQGRHVTENISLPLSVGITGSSRFAVLFVIACFAAGTLLLSLVDEGG